MFHPAKSGRGTKASCILDRIKPDNQVSPVNGRQYPAALCQRVLGIVQTVVAGAIFLRQPFELVVGEPARIYAKFFLARVRLRLLFCVFAHRTPFSRYMLRFSVRHQNPRDYRQILVSRSEASGEFTHQYGLLPQSFADQAGTGYVLSQRFSAPAQRLSSATNPANLLSLQCDRRANAITLHFKFVKLSVELIQVYCQGLQISPVFLASIAHFSQQAIHCTNTGHQILNPLANVPRGLGGSSRQGSYFISNYRKPTPMLSRPGGFDSGIQCEQVGLLCDIGNNPGDLLNLSGGFAQLPYGRR